MTAAARPATTTPRGLALAGRVSPGGGAPAFDGVVAVGADGRIAALRPGPTDVEAGLPVLGGPDAWVGPGVVDGHVHLAFGGPELAVAGGVMAARDLGAPPAQAAAWRTTGPPVPGRPVVAVAGPLLTAPGGYPSRGWGRDGFARFLATPRDAHLAVAELAAAGVDNVKLALEPAGGPVPPPEVAAAVVVAAHDRGLAVTAHALTAVMVARALDAGVDELCHTPVEPLPDALLDRVAGAGAAVVSTLETLAAGNRRNGVTALANARALHSRGVPLGYGTDLGDAGTRPGAAPGELALLADAGLAAEGALRAATHGAARAPGLGGRVGGRLLAGGAASVVLPGHPLRDPSYWRRPTAVLAGGRVVGS